MGTSRPLGPAALWNAASWLASSTQALIVAAVLVRCAGGPAFGIWATFLAWRAFLVVVEHGLGGGIARDVALAAAGAAGADAAGADAGAAAVRARLALRASLAWALLAAVVMLGAGAVTSAVLSLTGPAAAEAGALARLFALETGVLLATAPFLAVARGRGRNEVLGAAALLQLALVAGGALALGRAPGLVEVAWLVVGARVAAGGLVLLSVFALRLLPQRQAAAGGGGGGRAIVAYAAPLWLSALALQLATAADVPLVGAWFGAQAASDYALGTRLPLAGLGLLTAITAAALPLLAVPRTEPRVAISALLALATMLGTLGFVGLTLHADDLLRVWVGTASPLAVQVTAIHAGAYLLNLPAHVLSLAAIARGRHRRMSFIVAGEALVNLALSVGLAAAGFAAGPAWATLATLFVSNVLILPPLLRRELELPRWFELRPLAFGLVLGGGGALVIAQVTRLAGGSPATTAALFAALTLAFAGAALDLTLRGRSRLRAGWSAATRGGLWVWLEQRRERLRERASLRRERASAPLVWSRESPPLVTVRIATYNRGRLVAERAIASALRQTHANLEVLVVGDSCDEATERAVRSVRDPRVRFVNLPERGRYPADPRHRWMVAGAAPMNHALAIMRGEWLAPLDDDDEFTEDHVAVLLDACRTRELEFAWGKSWSEMRDGSWREVGGWPLAHGGIVHASVLYSARLRRFRHSLECWRLDEPGDWNLWQRMRRAGVKMGFVDRVVCTHYAEAREVKPKLPIWLGEPVLAGTGTPG